MMKMKLTHALVGLGLLSGMACNQPVENPAKLTAEEQALVDVKTYIQGNLDALVTDSQAICDAAPTTAWSSTTNSTEIANMRAAWKRARPDYEHVEGAIAVLFPGLDVSTDERYDGFVEEEADANLFDDEGVTGIHAIERILWSDSIPQSVITFESGLNNYVAARFPQTNDEASDFKNKLCARLVKETKQMRDEFKPLALDPQTAYRGVIGSMAEQVEKLNKATTGEEESRYAQFTLADMRANVEGGKATYAAFKPWLLEKAQGAHFDEEIQEAFERLDAAYAKVTGDALPAVPSTWSSLNPSQDDLNTPFGQLYSAVLNEADDQRDGALVFDLNESADALGIPQLPEN